MAVLMISGVSCWGIKGLLTRIRSYSKPQRSMQQNALGAFVLTMSRIDRPLIPTAVSSPPKSKMTLKHRLPRLGYLVVAIIFVIVERSAANRYEIVGLGKRFIVSDGSSLLGEASAFSGTSCAFQCQSKPQCGGFEYQTDTRICRLIVKGAGNASLVLATASTADVYWEPTIMNTSAIVLAEAYASTTLGTSPTATLTPQVTNPLATSVEPVVNQTQDMTTSITSVPTTISTTSLGPPTITTTSTVLSTAGSMTGTPDTTTSTAMTSSTPSVTTSPGSIIRQCTAPPSYGNYSQTTYAGTPQLPGQTITLSCKKGSAFNAAQLIQTGYATDIGGTNVGVSSRFRTIPITCDNATLTWLPTPANAPECQDFLECLRSTMGKEYFGTSYSKTQTGKSCINWGSVSAISDWSGFGNTGGVVFPTNAKGSQGAYCRNPGRDKLKPWCYVNTTTWEYCAIPRCLDPTVSTLECSLTSEGYDYMGVKARGSGGTTCQSWSSAPKTSQNGYTHNFPDDAYPHSYCRNPARDNPQPWCYTSVTSFLGVFTYGWENCGVSTCPGFP